MRHVDVLTNEWVRSFAGRRVDPKLVLSRVCMLHTHIEAFTDTDTQRHMNAQRHAHA